MVYSEDYKVDLTKMFSGVNIFEACIVSHIGFDLPDTLLSAFTPLL